MPHSSFFTVNTPEQRRMQTVPRVIEFSFFYVSLKDEHDKSLNINKEQAILCDFSLRVRPCNTMPSPMSQPDALLGKNSSFRRNYRTPARAVRISLRYYVSNNTKNVFSPCVASNVPVDVTLHAS
jgi:hypothetical protein